MFCKCSVCMYVYIYIYIYIYIFFFLYSIVHYVKDISTCFSKCFHLREGQVVATYFTVCIQCCLPSVTF